MHKVETTIRSLVVKCVFIAFGLISAVALYYRDGKIHVAKNGNVIIEEFFSLYVLLYLLLTALLLAGETRRIWNYLLVFSLWSLSLVYTTIWTSTFVAYDERKIEIISSNLFFKKETIIPFHAIKTVKKDAAGTGKYTSQLVSVHYTSDDGVLRDVNVYSGQFLNFFTRKNQQRRYEIFARAVTK